MLALLKVLQMVRREFRPVSPEFVLCDSDLNGLQYLNLPPHVEPILRIVALEATWRASEVERRVRVPALIALMLLVPVALLMLGATTWYLYPSLLEVVKNESQAVFLLVAVLANAGMVGWAAFKQLETEPIWAFHTTVVAWCAAIFILPLRQLVGPDKPNLWTFAIEAGALGFLLGIAVVGLACVYWFTPAVWLEREIRRSDPQSFIAARLLEALLSRFGNRTEEMGSRCLAALHAIEEAAHAAEIDLPAFWKTRKTKINDLIRREGWRIAEVLRQWNHRLAPPFSETHARVLALELIGDIEAVRNGRWESLRGGRMAPSPGEQFLRALPGILLLVGLLLFWGVWLVNLWIHKDPEAGETVRLNFERSLGLLSAVATLWALLTTRRQ
jgi:hypothetical protein